jgi:hypothetical protein
MNEIKQQLIEKIGDTSERATRIQQQVNFKKLQQPVVKKKQWAYYSTIVAFIGVLAFCIFIIPSVLNEGEGKQTEQEPPELVIPTKENGDGAVVDKGEYYELLKQYFFPDESEAVFLGGFENGGVKTQTFWLSDHYVQQIISHDGGIVDQIYRLHGNQIELVYEGMVDESGPSQWTIEELNKLPMLQIVLKAPFEIGDEYGEWTVIETSGQVTTTYGSFSNVLVVENADDDVRMRKYYVQGFGEVKWESAFLNKDSVEYEVFMTTDFATINNSLTVEEKTPSHFDAKVETNYKANSHSGWKTSPDGSQQATIAGRGEYASEEGEAVLVIENLETSESTINKLKDNDQSQYTPKYVEWIDDKRLFVIVGFAHGTVTRGGKLYELTIKDNIVTPVIEDLSEREEIMSLKVNEDGTFTYQKHVYENDNYSYNESHIEEGTLPIPPAK